MGTPGRATLLRFAGRAAATFGVLLVAAAVGGLAAAGITATFASTPRVPARAAVLTAALCFLCAGLNGFLRESLIEDLMKSFVTGLLVAFFAAAKGWEVNPTLVTVILVTAAVAPWPNLVIGHIWGR